MKIRITEFEATAEDLRASNTLGDNINRFLSKMFGCLGNVEKKENDDDSDPSQKSQTP
jgi:hypothetical protein